jgi:hypothetical protein
MQTDYLVMEIFPSSIPSFLFILTGDGLKDKKSQQPITREIEAATNISQEEQLLYADQR